MDVMPNRVVTGPSRNGVPGLHGFRKIRSQLSHLLLFVVGDMHRKSLEGLLPHAWQGIRTEGVKTQCG